ncbi:hypothetical protein [Phaeacidiphilus oryzae]|uniref:hypothetical protein n=1 Tax=Phaeacidiphilus oryzae TaxID=348818 RepID=UPI000568BD0B|nr:hypothetical protein [Phaeacidiphilus oryzae]
MNADDGIPRRLPPLGAGRRPAGLALLRWLEDPAAPRLCLLAGSPGSGRTHLLSWLATAGLDPAAPTPHRPHAILPAAGHTVRSASWLLAEQLNLTGGSAGAEAETLVAEIAEDTRPAVLLVAEVDRSARPAELMSRLLLPLAGLPQVRMVVDGVGPQAFDGAGGVLAPAVLDLDDERWTDRDAFARWYAALPGSPESGEPAFGPEETYPNPGLAQLTRLARRSASVSAGAGAGGGAGAGAAALDAWWASIPGELRPTILALGAIAPEGASADLEEWALLPGSGGAELVHRAAALLPPDTPSRDAWRLPHGLPAAQAASWSAGAGDHEAALLALARSVPRTADGGLDFAAAGPQRLGRLLAHAVRAGRSRELLGDVVFLAHSDPLAVTAAFEADGADEPSVEAAAGLVTHLRRAWADAGRALLAAPSAGERAAILRLRVLGGTAQPAADPLLAVSDESGGPGWHAEWARWDFGAATALTLGRHRHSGQLLVSDEEGAVRGLDPETGATLAEHGRLADFAPAALLCAPDGEIVPLDSPLADPDEGAKGVVRWGEHAERLHTGPVNCLAAVLLRPDPEADRGIPLLLSGGADGTVRLWSPGSAPAPAGTADSRPSPVTAVALADPTGATAVAWADGTIRVGTLELRVGAPAVALTFTSPTTLVAGLPDGLVAIRLHA